MLGFVILDKVHIIWYQSIAEDDTKLADPKMFLEAMMSEMRRVMKMEMAQVHERIDQMENRREE